MRMVDVFPWRIVILTAPMSIFKFACPSCQQRISASLEDAGTSGTCPRCGDEFTVPAGGTTGPSRDPVPPELPVVEPPPLPPDPGSSTAPPSLTAPPQTGVFARAFSKPGLAFLAA